MSYGRQSSRCNVTIACRDCIKHSTPNPQSLIPTRYLNPSNVICAGIGGSLSYLRMKRLSHAERLPAASRAWTRK